MKKGFVCVIDVLGFKNLTDERMVLVAEILEYAYGSMLPAILGQRIGLENRLEKPIALLFQDTIVIAFPLTDELRIAQTVFYAIHDCIGILYCALLAEGIKIRGAIGYGSIHTTEHGIFGDAVYDAAREYECADWAGIHYTVEAGQQIAYWLRWAQENNIDIGKPAVATSHPELKLQFYPVMVPFKQVYQQGRKRGDISEHPLRMVVPWPKDYRWIFSTEKILANDQRTVSTLVHEILDPELETDDEGIREKINNTLVYFDTYLKKYPDVNHRLIWNGPLPSTG